MTFSEPSRLQAHGVHVGYGARAVLDGIDFAVPDQTITAIIGPNGCGKSTLLRTLGNTLRPGAGHVSLDGASLHHVSPRKLARRVAMLPQAPTAPEGITVVDLVSRGRQPHQSWLRQWSVEDEAAVRRALELTGTTPLAYETLDCLSGGQQQRVWIAFVIAQDADILFLDEPTTFLDLAHAIEVLRLIETLHKDSGRTIVMVLHDLNLAVQYAHHLVVMHDGSIVAQGAPVDVLTADLLFDVFGLAAQVIQNPVGDGILVVPTKQPF